MLRRALLSALLLIALGTVTVSALDGQGTPARGDDEMDRAFAAQVVNMTDEIASILRAWSDAAVPNATSADNMELRSVGVNLSARSRYWYDTLGATPESGRFTASKQSMLLGLREFESAGNATVQAMDLALAGNDAASVPLILEAADHAERGAEYFATAKEQFPAKDATPAPPAGAPGAGKTWGKRYAVGNPGSYLGTRAGTDAARTATRVPRAVVTTGTSAKPGGRASGIAPPAGPFVRWYPGARWAAGLR